MSTSWIQQKIYSKNKWWGEFRFIWAVKDDSQGIITVTNARTDTDKGILWGNSAAYALKKGTENSWTTSRTQEITERKKILSQA